MTTHARNVGRRNSDTHPPEPGRRAPLTARRRAVVDIVAVIGCALGFLVATVGAQEEPTATFEGLAEVKEVLLDVLAVDRSGHTVVGLGVDDFIVEENGQEVDVTGVSFYTTRYADDGDGALDGVEDVVPASRYFILYLHYPIGGTSGTFLNRQQVRVRRDLLEWVEEHMLPSDWVAVVGYDVRLKVYQDFTQDRFALGEGIVKASQRKDPAKDWGRRGPPLPPSGAPSLLRHLPEGKALRKGGRNLYDATRQLAEATGFIVGRKNLVMFSTGFDELDSVNLLSEPDPRRYPPLEQALNDHNVAVYTIDLTPSEIRRFEGGHLSRLSLDTGGQYFRDPLSFLAPMRRISQENVGYYLLSYQSEHPADGGGYQEVKVRSRDRGIQLRARKGYRFGKE